MPSLADRLAGYLAARRRRALLRHELVAAAMTAAAFMAIAAADRLLELSEPSAAALAGLLGPFALATQFLVLLALRSERTDAAAAALEITRGDRRDDLLVTAVTLTDGEAARLGYAPWLVEQTRVRADRAYENERLESRLGGPPLRAPAFALALVFALLPLARLDDATWECVLRALRNASGGLLGPSPGVLTVTPGSADVPYGQPLVVRAFGSALPAMRFERIGPRGEVAESVRMARADGRFEHRVPAVTADFRFRVRTLRECSPLFTVRAVRHPHLTALQAAYEFPAYTGLERLVDDASRVVSGVRGTRVRLFARASKPLARAALVEGTRETGMAIRGDLEAELELVLSRSAECAIALLDREGFPNLAPERLSIECRDDRTPEAEILKPPPFLEWAGGAADVEVAWRAEDDFGLGAVRLFRAWGGRSAESMLHPGDPRARRLLGETRFPVPTELAASGGEIAYWVEALDHDDVSGPKRGRSAVHVIAIPSPVERAEAFEESLATAEARLTELREEERRLEAGTEELLKRIERAEVPSAADRREAEFVMKRQRAIVEEAREIERMLAEEVGKIRDNPYVKSGLVEWMNRLQALLREVATPEMQEFMRDLAERIDGQKIGAEEVRRFAREFDPKRLAEKLDRTIALIERMRDEQALHALAERIGDLARMERELASDAARLSRMEDAQARGRALEELARRQDGLSTELVKSLEKAEALAGKIAERSAEPAAALAEAARSLEGALGKEREVSSALRSGDGERGARDAETAHDGLAKAEREARDAFSLLARSRRDALEAELLEAARIARDVAAGMREAHDRIEDVRFVAAESLPGLSDRIARRVAAGSSHMATSAGILSSRLVALSRQSFQVSPELAAAVESILFAVREFEAALMERRYDEAAARAREANGNALRLAVVLLRLRDAVKAGGTKSLFQEYLDEMKRLAERQGKINASMPQSGDGPPGEDALRQLALEQAALRQGMEGMARRMEASGQMADRLNELADEMEDLEAEYLKRNIGERIRERQTRLHQRMLETVKALREEGETNERKAEAALPYRPPEPSPPPETGAAAAARRALERMAGERYPKEYEPLIRLYFERIGGGRER